jgi:hypothetical protein
LICGVRVGKVSSAFCHVDAQRLGIKLVPFRLHGVHMFQWSRLCIDGPWGHGIAEELADIMKAPNEKGEAR